MKRSTKDDAIEWFGALERSSAEARALRTGPTLGPVPRCLCGDDHTRDARILTTPLDLTDVVDDLSCVVNEGTRPCDACGHGIHHGAMNVRRHFTATSNVRDHYHPECVRF